MKQTLIHLSEMDMDLSPPAVAQIIHRSIRDLTGNPDPYYQIKRRFNKFALDLLPKMREKIHQSEDPFETAVRVAIAGNIIDFGVLTNLEESEVLETINQAFDAPVNGSIQELKERINSANKIFYLADNCGEIAFDKLLIEQLPQEKITVAVRGRPIINDALMEDAIEVGLPDLVPVIDNGTDAPGTVLEQCSEEFQKLFHESDFIIAKGQGNYETLNDYDKDIFFLLKAKCKMVAADLDCSIGTLIARTRESFQHV